MIRTLLCVCTTRNKLASLFIFQAQKWWQIILTVVELNLGLFEGFADGSIVGLSVGPFVYKMNNDSNVTVF